MLRPASRLPERLTRLMRRSRRDGPLWLAGRVGREVQGLAHDALDRLRSTYGAASGDPGPLRRHMQPLPIDTLATHATAIAETCLMFRQQRFDLLGSGWVPRRCDASPAARVNRANRRESARIRALIDDAAYEPIDWQLDVRSGHRWKETSWSRRIAIGRQPGVDVKNPWELARMQHLPQLACAYRLARANVDGLDAPGVYAGAFRNQVLDFIAANPVRFGVNWVNAMEVALRATSWVIAYDLFVAHGANFDAAFEAELRRSLRQHGRYVFRYLERGDPVANNHYLADIAGLLFIAAYLPPTAETRAWLDFAVAALVEETASQFLDDGAHFEASTCYHRLAAEMVACATALVTALPELGPERLPADHLSRIAGMADFLLAVTRPNGSMSQIGDNDSGRFLKLVPARDEVGPGQWQEDPLDVRDSAAMLNGLLARDGLAALGGQDRPEEALIAGLAGRPLGRSAPARPAGRLRIGLEEDWTLGQSSQGWATRIAVPGGGDLHDDHLLCFPDFGLFVVKTPRIFLTIRCGGASRPGGHAHLDTLGVELAVDGRDVYRDPGSFTYTADPALRNAYRSARAHFVPYALQQAPDGLDRCQPFEIPERPSGECLYWGLRGFVGRVDTGGGGAVVRTVGFDRDGITISDSVREAGEPCPTEAPVWPTVAFSPGYGRRSERWH